MSAKFHDRVVVIVHLSYSYLVHQIDAVTSDYYEYVLFKLVIATSLIHLGLRCLLLKSVLTSSQVTAEEHDCMMFISSICK